MSARFFLRPFFAPVPQSAPRTAKPRKVKKIALDKMQSGIALI